VSPHVSLEVALLRVSFAANLARKTVLYLARKRTFRHVHFRIGRLLRFLRNVTGRIWFTYVVVNVFIQQVRSCELFVAYFTLERPTGIVLIILRPARVSFEVRFRRVPFSANLAQKPMLNLARKSTLRFHGRFHTG